MIAAAIAPPAAPQSAGLVSMGMFMTNLSIWMRGNRRERANAHFGDFRPTA
jgi:hypothetical protein